MGGSSETLCSLQVFVKHRVVVGTKTKNINDGGDVKSDGLVVMERNCYMYDCGSEEDVVELRQLELV